MTDIKLKVETPVRRVGDIAKGTIFRHCGGVYLKTSRMVHEGTSVRSNAILIAKAESTFINHEVEVEVFNKAEIHLS